VDLLVACFEFCGQKFLQTGGKWRKATGIAWNVSRAVVWCTSLSIARRPWLLERQLLIKTKLKVITSLVQENSPCRLEPRAMLPSLLKRSSCRFVSAWRKSFRIRLHFWGEGP